MVSIYVGGWQEGRLLLTRSMLDREQLCNHTSTSTASTSRFLLDWDVILDRDIVGEDDVVEEFHFIDEQDSAGAVGGVLKRSGDWKWEGMRVAKGA